ncbi:MAG: class I SAM-dependent methyltransferase [Candidatus Marinarcus sp.]|uniref:class I SAM-dependent methyltransferase n=1 Tax=Candidatus Marinarcus sp. TaxID=3100987 RepID=UPI003AFF8D93
MENVKALIQENLKDKSGEFKRVFHGRGGRFKGFEFLTVDSIDKVLFVIFFQECEENIEKELLAFFETLGKKFAYESVVLQRRYLPKAPSETLYGVLNEQNFALENGLKYQVNFLNNQNIGFFADMKNGRDFIATIAKGKKVLNLFSYSCSFSVVAIANGASKVVNVDMSKQALSLGRQNHRLNHLSTSNVEFMPYNILKSWNRIKKSGPYDIIIIDPPSFQKGSFEATKDYEKIIRRSDELSSADATILSCLNAPHLDSQFIIEMFKTSAPEFIFQRRLDNVESFASLDEERSLKNLVFKRI